MQPCGQVCLFPRFVVAYGAMAEACRAPEKPFWAWAVYVIYCMEMSVVLILLPWTNYWEINYFFRASPALMAVGVSGYARGAVTALGAVLFVMGFDSLVRRLRGAWFPAKP